MLLTLTPTSFDLPKKCGRNYKVLQGYAWLPDLLSIRSEEIVNYWQPVAGNILRGVGYF